MYSLKDVLKAAEECKEALINIKTIEDVINLRKIGISESDVNSIDIGNGFEELDLHQLESAEMVCGVHLNSYKASNEVIIEDPIIIFDDGAVFHFDIWEMENERRESYEAFCDVSLDTVEKEYTKYVTNNCSLISNIIWDTDSENQTLPTEIYIPDHVEEDDIADYLSDLYGRCVNGFVIDKMYKIKNALNQLDVKWAICDKTVCIEFWTHIAGQDVPTEFEYDGTAEDFVNQFTEKAECYDVDEEVEVYVGVRGHGGVPDTIRELYDDCQDAKDTLLLIANKLQKALNGEDNDDSSNNDTEPLTFNVINLICDYDIVEEVENHLNKNDYHCFTGKTVEGYKIAIMKDELEYVKTILNDRNIEYSVEAA